MQNVRQVQQCILQHIYAVTTVRTFVSAADWEYGAPVVRLAFSMLIQKDGHSIPPTFSPTVTV